MSNNVAITPGSGVEVTSEEITGDSSQCQYVKLAYSAAGVRTLLQADVNGLLVNIGSGPFVVNNPTAANLKVDASGATVPISAASALTVAAVAAAPVFVRLSSGSAAVDTIPVTGTIAATQSGVWANKITDGTTTAAVDSSSGGLKVYIAGGSGGGGAAQADSSTFTDGTTSVNPIAGEFNDSATNPGSGKAGVVRITNFRALHVNLRANGGGEIGTSGSPVRVDPTGTTAQPIILNDSSGNPISKTNPVIVAGTADDETRVSFSVALASGTAVTAYTPTSGKRFYCRKLILTITASDTLAIFDGTNASANMLYQGTPPIGLFSISFDKPWKSAAINTILKYTAGSALTGQLVWQGYEA